MQLHTSDHPGLQLVATPLTSNNFLHWSLSIHRALGAKSKIELIDGSLPAPSVNSPYHKSWIKPIIWFHVGF